MYSYPYHGPARPNDMSPYYDRPGQPSRQYRPSTAPGQYPAHSYTQPAPPPQLPPHPHALRPGFAPSTTHRSDLFFSPPANPQAPTRPSYSAGPATQHQYMNQSHNIPQGYYQPPPLHPSNPLLRPPTAPPAVPPIPPKPSFQHGFPPNSYPDGRALVSSPPASRHHSAPPAPPPQPLPSSTDGGDDLALALALSQSETSQKLGAKDTLAYKEEEDLARAMEESLRLSKSTSSLPSSPQSAGPSKEKLFRAHSYTPGQTAYHLSSPLMPPSIPEVPSPIDGNAPHFLDDEAFARSLASGSDEDSHFKALTTVDTSKDEEFARRLANEDDTPAPTKSAGGPVSAGPSSTVSANGSTIDEDEAFARRLATEEELNSGPGTPSYAHLIQTSSAKGTSLPSYTSSPVANEAFTRKLATDEEQAALGQSASPKRSPVAPPPSATALYTSSSPSSPHLPSTSNTQSILPAYDDVVAANPSRVGSSALGPTQTPFELASPSYSEKSQLSAHRGESSLSVPGRPTLVRNDSASSSISSPVPRQDIPTSPSDISSRRPSTSDTNSSSQPSPTLPPSTPDTSDSSTATQDPSLSPTVNIPLLLPPVNANHFVDADLLKGVSIGFLAPSITQRPASMQGTFPNIINLPYGRSPPLHLQAPTWRSLLKLMARLSGTRVEPTVEGMAVAKHTMHLRSIVQFVKPHHSAPNWSVVLWFKIDHPVPPNTPNAHKYTNGDVSALPYAFTLGSVPTLLHDADSPVSKYYVIPTTDSLPFPALPVRFPDLAMYLQAALEESRRYMNDSSGGMRKLAKMVDQCFPNSQAEIDAADDERSGGMGGWLGRFGRRSNKNRRGGGNEDTYELVTPFVPDSQEWG